MASLGAPNKNVSRNPYVGPRTFKASEAHLFFGRPQEARDLCSLIVSERLVLFYAQSGAGKSSLINTRIIPMMTDDNFEILPIGRVSGQSGLEIAAKNIFIYNLIASLHQGRGADTDFRQMRLVDFLDNLVRHKRVWKVRKAREKSHHRFVAKIPSQLSGRFRYNSKYVYSASEELKPRVLIIDQFEEIFTTNTVHWQHRANFFEQLAEVGKADDQLWIVITMRADFIAELDPYLHLLPNRLRNRFYMQRLTRQAALAAIREPARQIEPKREFSPGAAELLVDNLLQIRAGEDQKEVHYDQFVEPVQLQAVCFQMWERLTSPPGTDITLQDVEEFADVDLALEQFYEETIAATVAATNISEIELRDWFEKCLVTEAGTRNLVFRGVEESGGIPTTVTDFVSKRFILHTVVRASGTFYELVHDRLVKPLQEANRKWRLDQPLIKLAQDWQESSRSDERLLDGRQLERFLDTNWQVMGPLVTAFIQASSAAEQTRRKVLESVEAERRQNELEQKRALADEQRMRAEEQQLAAQRELEQMKALAEEQVKHAEEQKLAKTRLEKRARLIAVSSVVILLLGVAATLFALWARSAEAEAILAAQQATLSKEAAVHAQRIAIEEAKNASAGRLAFISQSRLESNPELAVLLALEAQKIAPVTEAENVLSQAPYMLSRAQERVISAHENGVSSISYSPDARTLATGGVDGTARIWDVESGKQLLVLEGHTDSVRDVSYSPDARRLATASGDNTIRIWDAESGELFNLLEGHTDSVRAVSYNPDGSRIATGSGDSTVRIWDAESGEQLQVLEGHIDWVYDVSFSPDGRRIATASGDNTARIWDIESGRLIRILLGHTDSVRAASYSPDGSRIATASDDNTARIWDAESGEQLALLQGHTAPVSAVSFSPDGSLLATSSVDGSINLWNLQSLEQITQFRLDDATFYDVKFRPDGAEIAAASGEGQIVLWDISTSNSGTNTLAEHTNSVTSIAFSPDATRLASGSGDGTVIVWSIPSGEKMLTLRGHGNWVSDSAFSPNGTRIASGAIDGTIKLWDAESGKELASWKAHDQRLLSLAFDPTDFNRVASSSTDMTSKVWTLSSGRSITVTNVITSVAQNGSVPSIAFSRYGNELVSGEADAVVRIWDPNSGALLRSLEGHRRSVAAVAYSPAEPLLASGSIDGNVILWEPETGLLIDILSGSTEAITSLNFDPSGQLLAASNANGLITVWDVQDKEVVVQLRGHTARVSSVAFSPDGELLASGSDDSTIRLLNTSFISQSCNWISRNLSLSEWHQFIGTDIPYALTCPNLPLHPSYIEDARNLAREGNVEEAIEQLERALELDPTLLLDPETVAYDAAVDSLTAEVARLLEQGNTDQAITQLEKAVNLVLKTDDSYRTWLVCATGSSTELQEIARPACNRASELIGTIRMDEQVSGEVTWFSDSLWQFAGNEGLKVTITMEAEFVPGVVLEEMSEDQKAVLGDLLDRLLEPSLTLVGPKGAVVASNDDYDGHNSRIANFSLPADGQYLIIAEGVGRSFGKYRLTLSQSNE